MISPIPKKIVRLGLKERCLKLGKIIFPKPKLVVRLDDQVIPDPRDGRGALHAPAEQAGRLRSQSNQDGRGAPCVPNGSVPVGAKATDQTLDLGDRYTVLAKLGQGGSASVYKVQDKVLDKPFAVKVMRPELLSDNQAQLRFKQEAEAASCLTHPNLIAVYGSGIANDKAPYLVMDCLNGKTLAETLKEEEAIDRTRAVDILIQCCEALIHMHMKGIVHRDIKPSNIFLTKTENGTGLVKIVDFGIAKIQAYSDSTHLTQTGSVFGSPLYMSPEQCRGEPLDFRSDIYSLGCVAYEMLTGISPFAANNPIKTIVKHVSGSVTPPGKIANQHQIPEALQSIVMRCLETDPKKRYQTADELLNQLETLRTLGKLKTVTGEVFPSIYRRLAASMLDGIILSGFIIASTYLATMGQHHSLHLHFPLDISQLNNLGFFLVVNLVVWSLTIPIFGPAVVTMISILVYTDYENSLTFPIQLLLFLLLFWCYYAGFESSKYCGTPGKKMLGMTVVNSDGQRLSFLHASGRYFSKIFLLPLLCLENSLRIVPRIGESWVGRFFRDGKEVAQLVRNPPKPPTDDWTNSYVINTSAFNNPYLANLKEYLEDETKCLKNLNDINEKLKIIKMSLFWTIGLSLIVIFSLAVSIFCYSKEPPDLMNWSISTAFLLIWTTPGALYLCRLHRRKQQLLQDRNKKTSSTTN